MGPAQSPGGVTQLVRFVPELLGDRLRHAPAPFRGPRLLQDEHVCVAPLAGRHHVVAPAPPVDARMDVERSDDELGSTFDSTC